MVYLDGLYYEHLLKFFYPKKILASFVWVQTFLESIPNSSWRFLPPNSVRGKTIAPLLHGLATVVLNIFPNTVLQQYCIGYTPTYTSLIWYQKKTKLKHSTWNIHSIVSDFVAITLWPFFETTPSPFFGGSARHKTLRPSYSEGTLEPSRSDMGAWRCYYIIGMLKIWASESSSLHRVGTG